MVSLLLVSLYEFKQFLQIVLWIALPLTLVAVGITTFLHYRRKKKRIGAEPAYGDVGFHTVTPDEGHELPDWLGSTQPDNSTLLKKYEQEVRRSKENYAILEDDYRKLEHKYSDLLNKAYSVEKQDDDLIKTLQEEIKEYQQQIGRLKQQEQPVAVTGEPGENPEIQQLQATIQQLQEALRRQQEQKEVHAAEIIKLEKLLNSMEQSAAGTRSETEELQRYFTRQLDELGRQYKTDKEELAAQLVQSQQQVEQLTKEYNAATALQQALTNTEEEKTVLKDKLVELQYLKDVVEEKKLNIDFLQNQLEQRIKSYHHIEQEVAEKAEQLKQLQDDRENVNQRLQQQQEALRSKVTHIESLEFTVQELQQQQAALQSVIDDKQDAILLLQETVAGEQHKVRELESKLEQNNQVLVKIYSELSKSLNAGPMPVHNGAIPGLLNNSNGRLNGIGQEEYHFEEVDHAAGIH